MAEHLGYSPAYSRVIHLFIQQRKSADEVRRITGGWIIKSSTLLYGLGLLVRVRGGKPLEDPHTVSVIF